MKKISLELTGKLKDGSVVIIEGDWATGSEVYVIDEAGVKAPIFDGSHELESGDVFVTVGGKITEIKPKVEDSEVKPETQLEVEVKPEMVTKEEFNTLLEAFNSFKAEFSKEIFEAIVDSKINGLVKEEPKDEFKKVEEPKDYKSFILSRIEALNS